MQETAIGVCFGLFTFFNILDFPLHFHCRCDMARVLNCFHRPLSKKIIIRPHKYFSSVLKCNDLSESPEDCAFDSNTTISVVGKDIPKSVGLSYSDFNFNETEYYFENGLRKVYPYNFTHAAFCKERWIGKTILEVYCNEFGMLPLVAYQKRIRTGAIRVNGKRVDCNYVLRDSDHLTSTVHRHESPVLDVPIKVLYEDKDLFVIEKPCSMPVHPTGNYCYNTILFIAAIEHNVKGLYPINRLDRLTSGVLLYAKTQEKITQLMSEMSNHKIQKTYICRVEGEFPDGQIVCAKPTKKLRFKLATYVVCPDGIGKACYTEFQKLSYNGSSSVVLCKPMTGRSHQIRVHLQFLGFPIINDPLYNSYIFGPQKGKNGKFEKSNNCLIEDLENMYLLNDKIRLLSPNASEVSLSRTFYINNSKFTYKEDCHHCNTAYADPDPKTLQMFLHALKYEGPEWAYKTDLPLWACDHWKN